MNKKNDEITIQGLVDIFLPKLWLIAIVSILLAAVLGGYALFFTRDTYTSNTKYMVIKTSTSSSQPTTGLSSSDIIGMQGMIANAQEIIVTHDFCEAVIAELGRDDITIEDVKKMTTVNLSNSDATCYDVKVTSTDKQLACDLAAIAGDLLAAEFTNTEYAYRISQIETARVATDPNSKNVGRNAIIGLLVGALLSMVVIFVYDRFDIIIRSREKIENNFDIPILGVIPRLEVNK